jgi:protein ImuA
MKAESSSPGPAPLVTWPIRSALPGGAPAPENPSPAHPAERGRLHELHAASPADAPAAAAAALLMAGADCPDRPIAWLRLQSAQRHTGTLYGPGLAALGLPPERLLIAILPDEIALLKAGADLLGSRTLGAVLLELHGPCRRLDLTASRRLALAAAAGDCRALMLRVGADPVPSAAWRRWKVAAAPSRPLAAQAPGAPAFAFELLRNRSGPAGATHLMDWAGGQLAPRAAPTETADAPALSRDPLSISLRRSLPEGRRAA